MNCLKCGEEIDLNNKRNAPQDIGDWHCSDCLTRIWAYKDQFWYGFENIKSTPIPLGTLLVLSWEAL